MDNFTLPTWAAKAVYAFGIAAILGGSNLVVSNARDVAVLETKQTAQDERDNAMERTLTQRLDRMEGKIDVLIEKGHSHP